MSSGRQDLRSSITASVNESIIRMKSVGRLRVLKRDKAMGRPPAGTEAAGWLQSLATEWSRVPTNTIAGRNLSLPSALIELYSSMASNGISFIGRHEALPVQSVGALFPNCSIGSCGPVESDPFSVSVPTTSSSSTFAPVCMCHFNAIQGITRVNLKLAESVPTPQNNDPSTPLRVEDAFYLLWSGQEGSVPAHSNCTAGDGTGVDILLRYSSAPEASLTEPDVWGWVDGPSPGEGCLFYISNSFLNFVRLGCVRYCWARQWPLLFAPDAIRAACGLGPTPQGALLSSMRPWIEVFSGKPIAEAMEGVAIHSMIAQMLA